MNGHGFGANSHSSGCLAAGTLASDQVQSAGKPRQRFHFSAVESLKRFSRPLSHCESLRCLCSLSKSCLIEFLPRPLAECSLHFQGLRFGYTMHKFQFKEELPVFFPGKAKKLKSDFRCLKRCFDVNVFQNKYPDLRTTLLHTFFILKDFMRPA